MIAGWRWKNRKLGFSTYLGQDQYSYIRCLYFSALSVCWRIRNDHFNR
jgi:hypothetical protein